MVNYRLMTMKLALVLWFLLWARIGLPWRGFQWTPTFRRVELLPFAVGSTRTQTLNLLIFIPLGIIGTRLGWRPRTVMLVALAVSGLTEILQLFSTRRYPSTTDLILNTAGALIGLAIARGRKAGRTHGR